MLEVSQLFFERDQQILFSNLTFNLNAGTLLRVAGPNGSGKSTLLKILAGLLLPTAGKIIYKNNKDNTGAMDYKIDYAEHANNGLYRADRLFIGHRLGLLPKLTPIENLQWLMALFSKPVARTIILSVLQKLGLQNYKDIPCYRLSAGLQQRVALARIWLQSANIWILDEPFTALDNSGQILVKKQIFEHLNKGGIVIITDHQADASMHASMVSEEPNIAIGYCANHILIKLGEENQH